MTDTLTLIKALREQQLGTSALDPISGNTLKNALEAQKIKREIDEELNPSQEPLDPHSKILRNNRDSEGANKASGGYGHAAEESELTVG